MVKKAEIVQEMFSEKLKNVIPKELDKYCNAMNMDVIGFDGEEAPTYGNY